MNYSPKLKSAMEQIKNILKENDIAAFVVLHDKSQNSEYLNHISPSYSCAKFDPQGNIRITAKPSELGFEKAYKLQSDTYNMFTHLSDITNIHAVFFAEIKNHLQKILGGEDGESNQSSHQQQNN